MQDNIVTYEGSALGVSLCLKFSMLRPEGSSIRLGFKVGVVGYGEENESPKL